MIESNCNLMCLSCNGNLSAGDPASQYQRLKIIQNTVRVPSSLYTSDLGALNVYQFPQSATGVNWNQMSDKSNRHSQPVNVSSHGSSTRRTITRHRPNASTPGGLGVDIKHNSYYRYMDRLKAKKPIRRGDIPPKFGSPIVFNCAYPIYGGKTMKTSIVNGCNCPNLPYESNESQLYVTYYTPSMLFKPGCSTCSFNAGNYIYTKKSVYGQFLRALITAVDLVHNIFTIQFDDGTIETKLGSDIQANFICSCPGNVNVQTVNSNSHVISDCLIPAGFNSTNTINNLYLSCYPGNCNAGLISGTL